MNQPSASQSKNKFSQPNPVIIGAAPMITASEIEIPLGTMNSHHHHCMTRRLLAVLLTTVGCGPLLLFIMTMAIQPPNATARSMLSLAPQVTGVTLCNEPPSVAPYFDLVPSLDGAELQARLVGEGQIGATTLSTVYLGGTGHMLSWTDTLSDNVVTAVVPGVTPGQSISGTVFLTLTAPFFTQQVQFYRAYIPQGNTPTFRSPDSQVEIALVSTDTFTTNTYLLVMPSFGPPGPLPPDHCALSATYNLRAAGGVPHANRPLGLRLYLDALTIGALSPKTLTVLAWHEGSQQWQAHGGQYNRMNGYVTLATPLFTTYALVSAPRWRDEFDDLNGLAFPDEAANISIGGPPQQRALILAALTTSGFATSRLITPTITDAEWSTLVYSATTHPPTTTLTVDLLDASGALVRAALPSGATLTDLDPARYPALKLRVNLTSTLLGETPRLDDWQLGWRSQATPTPTQTPTVTPTNTPTTTPTPTPYYTNHLPLVQR